MEKVTFKKHARITTYCVGTRKFEMLKATVPNLGVRYFAIDHKYIDKDWRLTKDLNGVEMCMSESLQECMDEVNRMINRENFAKQHKCSELVASLVMNGMPMKQARKLEKDVLALGGK